MSGDVLEEAPSQAGPELFDDPLDVGPEVSLVVFPFALPGLTERLAWVSGEDGVDRSGDRSGVEGGDVIPDRGWLEVSGPLRGDKAFPRVLFPLDKASGVEVRLGEHEAHIKATGSGAEGQPVSGR